MSIDRDALLAVVRANVNRLQDGRVISDAEFVDRILALVRPVGGSSGGGPVSPEDAFRRVLAARLPAGPGWTAWIDGTVQELAGADAGRRTVERDTIRHQERRINAVLALCDEADELGGLVVRVDTYQIREALGVTS